MTITPREDVRARPLVEVGASAGRRASGRYERFFKSALDRAMAAALLALVLPTMALIALAVRLTLGRGVLFRQERVGRGGSRFWIHKFRTMDHDRRRAELPFVGVDRRVAHKHSGDPRHTTLGRFLRATSLDELPQLINVLVGDMSLVGPRPELPAVVATYAPWEHARHAVKPGITGLWQVSESRAAPMHEAIELDTAYASSVSLKADVAILARTVPAVLRRRTF